MATTKMLLFLLKQFLVVLRTLCLSSNLASKLVKPSQNLKDKPLKLIPQKTDSNHLCKCLKDLSKEPPFCFGGLVCVLPLAK